MKKPFQISLEGFSTKSIFYYQILMPMLLPFLPEQQQQQQHVFE